MLWMWSCPITRKELFLKIPAPKRQIKSLKTTCDVVRFYYICKLYTWNLLKTILSQAFFKGFAKIACDVNWYGTLKNLIIYFTEISRCFSHDQFIISRCFSHDQFIIFLLFHQIFEQLFSRNISQWLFQLIDVWK